MDKKIVAKLEEVSKSIKELQTILNARLIQPIETSAVEVIENARKAGEEKGVETAVKVMTEELDKFYDFVFERLVVVVRLVWNFKIRRDRRSGPSS